MNLPWQGSKPAGRYHHGALRQALLDAAGRQIAAEGLERLSLRACAREAGVAPSAVFRHFADARALLTAYATEGWGLLAEAILREQASEPPGPARFGAVGRAYVAFALAHPQRFRAMFRHALLDRADPALRAAEARVAAMQHAAMEAGLTPAPPERRAQQAALAWSIAHGLATLLIDGPLAEDVAAGSRETFVRDVTRLAGPAFGLG
jgi:AcrR family transcriptional regulator